MLIIYHERIDFDSSVGMEGISRTQGGNPSLGSLGGNPMRYLTLSLLVGFSIYCYVSSLRLKTTLQNVQFSNRFS